MDEHRMSGRPEPVTSGGVCVDASARRVSVDGVALHVTPIEYRLLEYLVRSAGSVVAREELLAAARQREAAAPDRTLDVHVSHLRKKLDTRRDLIRTIRGAGYTFESGGDGQA
jgi:DNA-binding response OmpR family regulator